MSEPAPLVSCIMPTRNRRSFVPHALRYFRRQDYANAELIVVDDGDDPIEDLVGDDPRIRYIKLDRRTTVGAKRNLACAEARGGIVVHWDDDDWSAPDRIRRQVAVLDARAADVCGTTRLRYLDLRTGGAWQFNYPRTAGTWVAGCTLAYRRSFWERNPFRDCDVGEDAYFVWSAQPERVAAIDDDSFMVAMIHATNVSPKVLGAPYWSTHHPLEVARLLGDDAREYALEPPDFAWSGESVSVQRSPEAVAPVGYARTTDLALPEFRAWDGLGQLPRMRRWEQPFALYQAHLGPTSRILDCSITPAGFGERIRRLFRHVLYRHVSPILNGTFVRPAGVPDQGFDRVFCINTLEHLTREQRYRLLADLVRALRPGGALIVTIDQYFEDSWDRKAFTQLGVMRPDRIEIFNGYNKVTASEVAGLLADAQLAPAAALPDHEPRRDDAALYLQDAPFEHAAFGAVFTRGGRPLDGSSRRGVVLALLTWNTRIPSLESLAAHVREARTLMRLGHDALLCVCDNGSTDGTAQSLREIDETLDVPHRFIYNLTNRGNCIARNQIIDVALEHGADYLLFVDGDIELIPFSSVAMLRFAEDEGHALGCIGADLRTCTHQRELAAAYMPAVEATGESGLLSWTQYGLFRCDVFRDDVRFDETPPFDGVGWGFEDNDLAFQMTVRNYAIKRFIGVPYLHRSARSSVHIMRAQGVDPEALYRRRRDYVLNKWSNEPSIDLSPLADPRMARIPMG